MFQVLASFFLQCHWRLVLKWVTGLYLGWQLYLPIRNSIKLTKNEFSELLRWLIVSAGWRVSPVFAVGFEAIGTSLGLQRESLEHYSLGHPFPTFCFLACHLVCCFLCRFSCHLPVSFSPVAGDTLWFLRLIAFLWFPLSCLVWGSVGQCLVLTTRC